jgi:chemotaxis protein methyltransferase CheR
MTGTTTRATPATGPALPRLSDAEFDHIRALVRDRSAIVLDDTKQYLVQTRLVNVLRSAELPSFASLVDELRRRPHGKIADDVVEAMTTNETSFFRDVHPFETLRKVVLPELIAARQPEKRLSIWCAAASSGQEPYTIALVLKEYFPELAGWQVLFRATDISQDMLRRCREGRYSQLEVNRGLPAALLVKYFRQDGAHWQVRDDLRAMIDFQPLNLAAPWPVMPAFDLVFLRNVMIYFDVETKKAILGRVARLLRSDGYLVLGGAETTFNLDSSYERVESLKSGYYRLARK